MWSAKFKKIFAINKHVVTLENVVVQEIEEGQEGQEPLELVYKLALSVRDEGTKETAIRRFSV